MNDGRTLVLGVDFSGARDAGRKIWIAAGYAAGRTVTIHRLTRAADLLGGVTAREPALAALRVYLAAQPPGTIIGCDFPFSLARAAIPYPTWDAFAAHFAADYPTPDRLFAAGRTLTAVRVTDRVAKTPFAPHNLRLYRQTYYGIRDLLHPLAAADRARIVPMQPYDPAYPTLIEICPASTLKRLSLYTAYKGRARDYEQARRFLLADLADHGLIVPDALAETAVANADGDALDALIAALAAGHALPALTEYNDAQTRLEGRVYF